MTSAPTESEPEQDGSGLNNVDSAVDNRHVVSDRPQDRGYHAESPIELGDDGDDVAREQRRNPKSDRRPATARRKRPWRDMTLIDGSPLRTPSPGDVDVDGDQLPSYYRDELAEAQIQGLVAAGHGFTVEQTATAAPVAVSCRYCGGPLFDAGSGTEWLCEFGEITFLACECNWCLCRGQWLAGQYRRKGRPRIQCGADPCKRALAAERKRRSRATGGKSLNRKFECHV